MGDTAQGCPGIRVLLAYKPPKILGKIKFNHFVDEKSSLPLIFAFKSLARSHPGKQPIAKANNKQINQNKPNNNKHTFIEQQWSLEVEEAKVVVRAVRALARVPRDTRRY